MALNPSRTMISVVVALALAGCARKSGESTTNAPTPAAATDTSAIASPTPTATDPLTGESVPGAPSISGVWMIDGIDGARQETPAGVRALYIEFRDDIKGVHGFSGCNTFSGSYEVDGTSLKFGPLISTRMACAPEINTLESRVLQSIQSVTGFKVMERTLQLSAADGKVVLAATAPRRPGADGEHPDAPQ